MDLLFYTVVQSFLDCPSLSWCRRSFLFDLLVNFVM
uniref:Uncharacterized protein n=1 Tax=Solanum lycopersicum TaxID=4081 RepID=K4CYZ1_SOLLC